MVENLANIGSSHAHYHFHPRHASSLSLLLEIIETSTRSPLPYQPQDIPAFYYRRWLVDCNK